MKSQNIRFVPLLLAVTSILSCGPYRNSEITGRKLPAQEFENQNATIRNILNNQDSGIYQKVIVDDREYPITELKRILDTISPNYTLEIKQDSIANKQLIVIKPKL